MQKITIATRILPDWHHELNQIMDATGQTQSQVVEEAIGQYLKKSRRLKVIPRIEQLETRLEKLTQLVIK